MKEDQVKFRQPYLLIGTMLLIYKNLRFRNGAGAYNRSKNSG